MLPQAKKLVLKHCEREHEMETSSRQADIALVQQLADGHEGALAEVYRRHGGPVLGLAKRLLRDTDLAQEIVQEVMLRLWNNPEKFDGARGSLRSYLLAHTHGRSVDLIRSESSRRMREERDAQLAVQAGLSLEEEVWEMALADHVRDALSELDEGVRNAIELAYGRKRTLEIATTLAMEPELMLLDEPTSGMGHEDVALVKNLIKEVAKGRTVLMVEHNMGVVSDISDTITVLQHGAVLTEGPYEQVSANPQVIEAYMGSTETSHG